MAAVSNSAVRSGCICGDGGLIQMHPYFLGPPVFCKSFQYSPVFSIVSWCQPAFSGVFRHFHQYFLGSATNLPGKVPEIAQEKSHLPGSVPRLAYASQEMQQDREVVLAAVKHDGTMLQFSSGGVKTVQ